MLKDPFFCHKFLSMIYCFLDITFQCEPETEFLYNQYECYCSGSGKNAVCAKTQEDKTLEYRRAGKKVFSIAEFPDLCTPGMIFKELCNVCICGSNEKAACTKIDCDLGWSTEPINDQELVGEHLNQVLFMLFK